MREITIISGKGGTGKTSITASFALLANGEAVITDCDVDAADLHLLLTSNTKETHDFYSGKKAIINMDKCTSCDACLKLCRFDAIHKDINDNFIIDSHSCEGCGVCVEFCPYHAIDFNERLCGEWMISETRAGTMVHAKLGVAAENSGKLVSLVRKEAMRIAKENNKELIITDGPPGIGCPVIAAITGTSQILVVTEPTLSGKHDLERVLQLAKHFKIPTAVCVNKWDINHEMTKDIENFAINSNARLVGRISYNKSFVQAQLQMKSVVEIETTVAEEVKEVWNNLINKGE